MTLDLLHDDHDPDGTAWWKLTPDNANQNYGRTEILFLVGPIGFGTTVNIETRYFGIDPKNLLKTDLYLSPEEARDLGTLLLYHADRAQDNIDRRNDQKEQEF